MMEGSREPNNVGGESRAGVKVGGFGERGRWKRDEMRVTASQGESRQGKGEGEGGTMRCEARRGDKRFDSRCFGRCGVMCVSSFFLHVQSWVPDSVKWSPDLSPNLCPRSGI